MRNKELFFKNALAEFLGTYFLVFFGTGAIMVNAQYGGVISHLGVALAFGAVVMTMIFAFGDVSGAHLNPAVSIAFWLAKKLPFSDVLVYSFSQTLGAITSSYSLFILFPNAINFGETTPSGTVGQAFLMEFILSFFLMLVIIFVATGSKEKGILAAIAVGFAVFVCALVGGPVSVASMNPARTIGPAIVSGNYEGFWLYIVAPILGMGLSVLSWTFINKKNTP